MLIWPWIDCCLSLKSSFASKEGARNSDLPYSLREFRSLFISHKTGLIMDIFQSVNKELKGRTAGFPVRLFSMVQK